MNKFNKLYNTILQSVILEDINSKIKKAVDTLIKSGQLKDENDPKAQLVKDIIKRNNSIDINGKTKLNQLLKANQKYTNRAEVTKDNYLDSILEFTQKKEYPNGVVTYKVQNTKAGQLAVRKVVDAQWGEDANPWCLISRKGDGLEKNYRQYWIGNYNAIPKAIAFQNGKLLAFHASSTDKETWWDRNDKSSASLKLLDGKRFKPKPYTFKDIFERYPKLTLNKETNRYDYDENIEITETFLKDGHFLIPFGVIKGRFICKNNKKLTSLFNGPTQVTGDFDCDFCENLQSLKGGPIKVGGIYACASCPSLQSLEGAPRYVPQGFYINGCKKLKTLQGGPEKVGDYYACDDCSSLTSLIGAPEYVGKTFSCDRTAITTLEGSPREVGSQFSAQNCQNLVSLQGGPEKIKFELWVRGCPKLRITREDAMKYRIQRDDD